jgi:hypothetical protein
MPEIPPQPPPDHPIAGYDSVQTEERVDIAPVIRWLRSRASQYVANHPPLIASYHYRLERTHFWPVPRWAIVPYQNVLRKVGE